MKKRILLTRTEQKNHADSRRFAALGYESCMVSLSEFVFAPATPRLKQTINRADWLFFTSQTPVRYVLALTETAKKIAVIGEQTAEAVKKAGAAVDFISPEATKAALIRTWQTRFSAGQHIFYPKSQLADDFLERELGRRHAVASAVVYQNRFPASSRKKLRALLAARRIDAVYLASPSAWRRFFSVYQPFSQTVPLEIFVIGTATQAAVRKVGFTAKIL
ncbi:uroporphyrinogen-III synthase [Enterococcus hirae]|nr:uroporphyrinogen-III synthase [Enterococcus hirae]